MELTCSRCHQTVQPGDCFCPVCGLPQLVYTAEGSTGTNQPERWADAVRDTGAIDWKTALRSSLALAVPCGILCAVLTRVGLVGALLMPIAAAWVVALYMRSRKPTWITIGAGARIGLVSGILSGWAAALTTGISLYGARYWLHQGKAFDNAWQNEITLVTQQLASMGFDPQAIAENKSLMLSPEGRAASMLFNTVLLAVILLAFSVAGGMLSARFLGRPRRTEQ